VRPSAPSVSRRGEKGEDNQVEEPKKSFSSTPHNLMACTSAVLVQM